MLCIKETTKIETSSTANENQKEVSKASQKNELLLTVPGERSYKDTFITLKKNVVIFRDSLPKGISTAQKNEVFH